MGCSASGPVVVAPKSSERPRCTSLVKVTCSGCGQGAQAQVPDGEARCKFTCLKCGARTAFANPYVPGGVAAGAAPPSGDDGKVQVACGGCGARMLVATVPGQNTLRFDCALCSARNRFDNPFAEAAAAAAAPPTATLPTLLTATSAPFSVVCGACGRSFGARVPPGGAPCQAKCPHCGRAAHIKPTAAPASSPSGSTTPASPLSDTTLAGGASSVVMLRCGSCDQTICTNAVGAAKGGRCRVMCRCGQVTELSIGLSRSEWADVPVEFPEYWSVTGEGEKAFREETAAIKVAVQRMLDETWKNRRTRDSMLRGKRRAQMEKFEVVQVQRNENPRLWVPYFRLRAEMAAKIPECPRLSAKTGLRSNCPLHRRAKLLSGINEVYLFHGTQPSCVRDICDDAFALGMAGINAGSLYGPGLYFAEASSKADEYADDDKQGIFMGLYAMLLCRVVCGRMNHNKSLLPNAQELVDSVLMHRTHHSVLGDREACRGTYREFVVFDSRQVYPEYVVIYRRLRPAGCEA